MEKSTKIFPVPGDKNLHKSYSKMLILAQIFGFFPVQGVRGPDFRSLRFSWKSARVVYALFTLLGTFLISGFQMQKIATKGLDLLEANRLFFFLTGVMASLLFLNLAKRWPKFVKDWCVVDATFASYGWPKGLNKKLNTLTVVFMLIALGEHWLSRYSWAKVFLVEHILVQTNKLVLALECNNTTAEGFTYFLGNMSFAHIFALVEYDIFKALVLQTINLQITFIWTYNDLFVMLISTALAYRFGQITRRIAAVASEKVTSEKSWIALNDDYNRLCHLCFLLDEKLSYIILTSFLNNFYFIIFQVFESFYLHKATTLETVYYFISLGLLILRLVSVCFYGSWINEESKLSLDLLSYVPREVYNKEISRLVETLKFQSITSAVVTYELIVIQFRKKMERDEKPYSRNSIC
uniref:Gustatory receptor n=1 Tax=Tribolium castaneum TaxID=7070 RepID=A2AX71_TRICA|nr:gustatory receptor candidate 9 [Tribolium castaneum]